MVESQPIHHCYFMLYKLPFIFTYFVFKVKATPMKSPKLHPQKNKSNENKALQAREICVENIWLTIYFPRLCSALIIHINCEKVLVSECTSSPCDVRM